MRVYGPYKRKDGRKHVILIDDDGSRRTVSYPKFLMEQYLGRQLSDNETVDHIDGDFTNNEISNLQILSRSKHAKLDVRRVEVKSKCALCGTEFVLSRNQRSIRAFSKTGPFCSKRCAGIYGARKQKDKTFDLPRPHAETKNYSYKQEPDIGNSISGDGDIGETFDNGNPEGTSAEGTVETR